MIQELTPEFAEKIRIALLEELGTSINTINELIGQVVEIDPDENDSAMLRNGLIAIAQSIGYSSAVFNKLYILETGEVKDDAPRAIGFRSLHDDIETKKKSGKISAPKEE